MTRSPLTGRSTTQTLVLLAGACLAAVSLTACGGGTVTITPAGATDAAVTVGSDGASVSDGNGAGVQVGTDGAKVAGGGAQVSVGADGVVVSDGQGGQVSVGADGSANVTDGQGGSVSVGGGTAVVTGGGATVKAGSGGATVSTGSGAAAGSSGAGKVVTQGTYGTTGQVTLSGDATFSGKVAKAVCDVNGDQRTVTATTGDGYKVVVDTNGAEQVTLTVDGPAGSFAADFNGGGAAVVALTPGRTVVKNAKLVGDTGNVTLQATFVC